MTNYLPKRTFSHKMNDEGLLKCYEIFKDPYFIVRDETKNDYGVDIVIEALIDNGKYPSNIRAHVQLKSSSKTPNKSDSFSYSIPKSNLNYLINSPHSLYVFYSKVKKKLYFRTADSVFNENYSPNSKSITVLFSDQLNGTALANIHQNMVATSLSIRDLLLSQDRRLILNPDEFVYRTDENGKVFLMHQEIWEETNGEVPEGYEVYHINGNFLDNQKKNLSIRKTDNPFPIEQFQIEINNYQLYNILAVLLNGDKAELIEDIPTPPKKMLINTLDSLKEQGWTIDKKKEKQLLKRFDKLLGVLISK